MYILQKKQVFPQNVCIHIFPQNVCIHINFWGSCFRIKVLDQNADENIRHAQAKQQRDYYRRHQVLNNVKVGQKLIL